MTIYMCVFILTARPAGTQICQQETTRSLTRCWARCIHESQGSFDATHPPECGRVWALTRQVGGLPFGQVPTCKVAG